MNYEAHPYPRQTSATPPRNTRLPRCTGAVLMSACVRCSELAALVVRLGQQVSRLDCELAAATERISQLEYERNADKYYQALEKILNGRYHIGNDENGNMFGPPDSVMCRRIASEALQASQAEEVMPVNAETMKWLKHDLAPPTAQTEQPQKCPELVPGATIPYKKSDPGKAAPSDRPGTGSAGDSADEPVVSTTAQITYGEKSLLAPDEFAEGYVKNVWKSTQAPKQTFEESMEESRKDEWSNEVKCAHGSFNPGSCRECMKESSNGDKI